MTTRTIIQTGRIYQSTSLGGWFHTLLRYTSRIDARFAKPRGFLVLPYAEPSIPGSPCHQHAIFLLCSSLYVSPEPPRTTELTRLSWRCRTLTRRTDGATDAPPALVRLRQAGPSKRRRLWRPMPIRGRCRGCVRRDGYRRRYWPQWKWRERRRTPSRTCSRECLGWRDLPSRPCPINSLIV